ncbi:MAG: response regulator transcription factor [Chloroflexi bacterium]|nr:response regulator transcription factor [Chloroflexota bacterium]
MKPLRILLADDHPLFLEGLQNLLKARGIEVVGTAGDGFEALSLAQALRPDVVLMDIQMPRCNGLEAIRMIKAVLPDIKVVMLTVSANDDDLFEAIKSGASGYLLKNMAAPDFFRLLSGVAQGEAPITREMAAKVLNEFARQSQESPSATKSETDVNALTPRQSDVLELVAQGYTNKEIAEALSISGNTVKYHMKEILQKLHLQNRNQVIAYAVQTGLIQPGVYQ